MNCVIDLCKKWETGRRGHERLAKSEIQSFTMCVQYYPLRDVIYTLLFGLHDNIQRGKGREIGS